MDVGKNKFLKEFSLHFRLAVSRRKARAHTRDGGCARGLIELPVPGNFIPRNAFQGRVVGTFSPTKHFLMEGRDRWPYRRRSWIKQNRDCTKAPYKINRIILNYETCKAALVEPEMSFLEINSHKKLPQKWPETNIFVQWILNLQFLAYFKVSFSPFSAKTCC